MLITTSQTGYGTEVLTNFSIIAGETVATAIAVSTGKPATPIDLTSYTLQMQINFPTPLLLNTTNNGITITDAAQGQAQVNIPSATSAELPQGSFPYDLWMKSPSGVDTPLLKGTFKVYPNVSPVP